MLHPRLAARRIQAGVHVQNRAVVNLFRGPNLIEDVAVTMRRLEEGDLKLRVRALDSERALTRVLVRHPHACSSFTLGDSRYFLRGDTRGVLRGAQGAGP